MCLAEYLKFIYKVIYKIAYLSILVLCFNSKLLKCIRLFVLVVVGPSFIRFHNYMYELFLFKQWPVKVASDALKTYM